MTQATSGRRGMCAISGGKNKRGARAQMCRSMQATLATSATRGSAELGLTGGGHACIQSLSVFFGSVLISQIDEFGALFCLTQDFTTDLDSLRSGGTVRGVADFALTTLLQPQA
eukprot:CAMPEP_0179957834 /NCGR_PEP_ID=MMETSP0983-20121128/27679_1 /TAXON_ID=483367 /ORGANISM="non described non described, Strain CCMP 2436" /LENGTH=113 /DNA_ID=CAMNT_0021869865 /DNA_START=18 /DNA_END=360 /DNA_ORIENTATION=-